MTSYPLTEPPLDAGPKSPFLPLGLAITAAVVLSLSGLLWYGCGWMVTSDVVWRHVGANMRGDSSSQLAVHEQTLAQDESR